MYFYVLFFCSARNSPRLGSIRQPNPLFALAAFAALASVLTLLGHFEPRPSFIGTVVLILAALIMPGLVKQKRRLCAVTGSL